VKLDASTIEFSGLSSGDEGDAVSVIFAGGFGDLLKLWM
jgi:hypothetical protein